MKSNAPWSVKGIERDARETAKEAAKREGMTVGEWLNQMIYAAGDPESSGGEVEGLKLRDIVTAIDHLNKRIADGAAANKDAVSETTRKLGDVVERVQRLERNRGGDGDRERVDALKALEKAVAQVAVQFSNSQKTMLDRLDATESQIQQIAGRVDASDGEDASGVGRLKDAIDGLQARVGRAEKLANAVSREGGGVDPEFVAGTDNRLRVLGDEIKRGGDQIRALEEVIGKLAQQIEAAERRSAEGVQKTAETLAELREKFAGGQFDGPNREDIAAVVADHTRDTVDKVDRLQTSFERMIERLESLGDETPSSAPAPLTFAETEVIDEPAPASDEAETAETLLTEIEDALDVSDDDQPVLDEPVDIVEEPEIESETLAMAEADEPQAAAAETEGSDDDFFSFADEIDASLDEATESADEDDDFTFELDDQPQASDDEGAALLSEVQQAFSEPKKPETSQPQEETDDDPFADNELDELLAGIDELTGETSPPPRVDEEAAEDAGEDGSSGLKENYLKEIRRKAREEAEKREAEETAGKRARRKLTPKQKAILAARARKKRLAAAAEGEHEAITPEKRAAAKKALAAELKGETPAPESSSDEDGDDAQKGIVGKISALAAGLPFLQRKKKDEGKASADDAPDDPELNGDRAALETLKSTASARPVTLGIAVSIFLLVGLLFFAVKDRIFSPRADDAARPVVAEATAPIETAEPTLEVPEPPAIDPRTLYRDAMTALGAAQTEAESEFAIDKLQEAALLGHPPAQLQLGELYKTGQGVETNLSEARSWFQRSANGGNVLAMHRLGIMLARGDGGPADTQGAIAWFEQAANRGLVDSQYNLGALYQESVEDLGKAYYWYAVAAKNGDNAAKTQAEQVGAVLEDSVKADLDKSVGEWEALPSDAEANALAAG